MQNIDVGRLVDESTFGNVHLRIIIACAIVLIVDGYDVFIYGTVLPHLMEQWHLTPPQAGSLASCTLVALMFCGCAVGGMAAAGIGIWLLPRFGWEAMFFATAAPLLLLPLILRGLPESAGVLIRRGEQDKARAILRRLSGRTSPLVGTLSYPEATVERTSVGELFRHDRAPGTAAMWVCFFCCLLMVYALGSWLPQLMRSAGYSLGSSLSYLFALNFVAFAIPGLVAVLTTVVYAISRRQQAARGPVALAA